MKNTNSTPMIHRIALKDRNGRVIGEKEVVSYAGLLDLAHKERLDSIETSIVQLPAEANGFTAIVRAVVRTAGGTYSAHGDANVQNVAAQIGPHYIRMAETRAVARALRSAVNVGAVALEELGGDVEVHSSAEPANDNAAASVARSAPAAVHESSRASDAQRKLVWRLLMKKGLSGDDAKAYVQRELGGDGLVKSASKQAVSGLIDKLMASERAATGTGG